MILFGLIGYPLGHSWSPEWFRLEFKNRGYTDWQYHLFPIENAASVRELVLAHPTLSGLNVTIPHKETVIPYLDEIDPVAASIGAVNLVIISRDSGTTILTGYNTDSGGFYDTITESMVQKKALVLGYGGAAKAVCHALKQAGIIHRVVSRSGSGPGFLRYEEISREILAEYLLIINTTPLGMFPNTGDAPSIPYQYISGDHLLYDLVYNPELTLFLRNGLEHGATVVNGKEMLIRQAERSLELFLGDRHAG